MTGCHGVLKDDAVRGPRCEALVLMNAILPLVEENSIVRVRPCHYLISLCFHVRDFALILG